jgi:hypothetical protein
VSKTEHKDWSVRDVNLLKASDDGTVAALLSTPRGEGRFRRLPGKTNPAKGEFTYIQLDPSNRQTSRIEIKESVNE